jgi:hypothetical protein
MKVETKIVPVEVKDGWFKKKQMHQFRYRFLFTETETAIITQSGLGEFPLFEAEEEYFEPTPVRFFIGAPDWSGWSYRNFNTLIEAQAMVQKLKINMTRLKEIMDAHSEIGTEDSFEL